MKSDTRWLISVLLLLAFCTSSCFSTVRSRRVDEGGTLISRVKPENGGEVAWRIYPAGHEGLPKLSRTVTAKSDVARVGVAVNSITGKRAEELGIDPWQGVLVTRVIRNSPAQKAGVRRGDVIHSIAGTDITSDSQFIEVIERELTPEEPAEISILRKTDGQAGAEGTVLSLRVTPDARQVTETSTDSYELESAPGLLGRTGLQVATVPVELSEEIFGVAGPTAVVAGVVSGSPAYMSGLRGGDRILACNGNVVKSAGDVRDAANVKGTKKLELEVDGPLGPHETKVAIEKEIQKNAHLHVPIVWQYRSRVDHTRWSFLDFIFQFGANYSSTYRASKDREPSKEWDLSLFPFGMFEFEEGPRGKHYTLLWFIHWSTD